MVKNPPPARADAQPICKQPTTYVHVCVAVSSSFKHLNEKKNKVTFTHLSLSLSTCRSVQPWHSRLWPETRKPASRATHQIPAKVGCWEGSVCAVPAVPGDGRQREAGSPEGVCSLVEPRFQCRRLYACVRVRTRVGPRVRVPVCVICCQSRKQQFILFILSMVNKPGSGTDNIFFFKKEH